MGRYAQGTPPAGTAAGFAICHGQVSSNVGHHMKLAPVHPSVAEIWNNYAMAVGGIDASRFYESFFFADSEETANSLAQLVLAGTKRATAAALWSFEAEGKRLPVPGDLSVVTDWSGVAQCIIETMAVEITPFSEVTAEFAATEGEGDGSLEHWRAVHRQFFSRECAQHGRTFTEDMLVACERFRVVFQPGAQNAA